VTYRKKKTTDAFKVTNKSIKNTDEWPMWIEAAECRSAGNFGALWWERDGWMIGAKEGPVKVPMGSWIVVGDKQGFSVMSEKMFEEHYEPVVDVLRNQSINERTPVPVKMFLRLRRQLAELLDEPEVLEHEEITMQGKAFVPISPLPNKD